MKLRYLPIAVLLLLALVFAFNRAYWAYMVSVERKNLRELGYPSTKEEFAEWYALPEGTPNAADLYLQAFDAYNTNGIDYVLLPVTGWADIKWREPLPKEVFDETRRFIEQNRDCIELLERAGAIEVSRMPADFTRSTWEINRVGYDGHSSRYRKVARLLSEKSFYLRDMGDAGSALGLLRVQFGIGRSMYQDYDTLTALAGAFIDEIARGSATQLLTMPSASDEHFAELDSLIEFEVPFRQLEFYLLSEICLQDRPTDALSAKPRLLADWDWLNRQKGWEVVLGEATAQDDRTLYRLLKLAQWYINTPETLDVDRLFTSVPSELGSSARPTGSVYANYAAQRVESALLIVEYMRQIRLRMNLIRIGAAIERHRLAHGGLPLSLAQIDPALLSTATIDPHTGQTLGYTVQGNNYWVYSVGSNGVDDGGFDPVADREVGDDIAVAVIREAPAETNADDGGVQ